MFSMFVGHVGHVGHCRTWNILKETFCFQQVKNLFKVTTILNRRIPGKRELASSLATMQSLIFEVVGDLFGVSEEDIASNLASQKVLKCKRLTQSKDEISTRLLLLKFRSKTLPERVPCKYSSYSVDLFIPNPLRCFN